MYGDENGVYAKVIADSVSQSGDRLTTMEVQCHRFVLAEFNTHRKFSRNSASSRAIPVDKQIERVRKNPAIPLSFPAEQKGMQGGEELSEREKFMAAGNWISASRQACDLAEATAALKVHKSVVNRLLEPFMWHKIIVSSTEWKNFFIQRCSPLAQPEIKAVAELMQTALSEYRPREFDKYEWHLPYIDNETYDEIKKLNLENLSNLNAAAMISAARCARVSYLTHDGKRSLLNDLDLYSKLVSAEPAHWSPLEHVATPDTLGVYRSNFDGWIQLRALQQNGLV